MTTESPESLGDESSRDICSVVGTRRVLSQRLLLGILAALEILVNPLLLVRKKLNCQVGDEQRGDDTIQEGEIADRSRNRACRVLRVGSRQQQVRWHLQRRNLCEFFDHFLTTIWARGVAQTHSSSSEQDNLGDRDEEKREQFPLPSWHLLPKERPAVVFFAPVLGVSMGLFDTFGVPLTS